jgi:hypothetical protein
MITMWYSKLFSVLLSAMVLTVGVGWCCAHTTGPNDTDRDMGAHDRYSVLKTRGQVANTSSLTHHGAEPSHSSDPPGSPGPSDHDDSGCQDKISMLSTAFDSGAVYTDPGSSFQDAPALVLAADPSVWLVRSGRVFPGFQAPPDLVHGDSLRALSCLTIV